MTDQIRTLVGNESVRKNFPINRRLIDHIKNNLDVPESVWCEIELGPHSVDWWENFVEKPMISDADVEDWIEVESCCLEKSEYGEYLIVLRGGWDILYHDDHSYNVREGLRFYICDGCDELMLYSLDKECFNCRSANIKG